MNKSEKGSILFLVLIVFLVVIVLGTAMLTRANYSQRYAVQKTNQQQAYYMAKSVVDGVIKQITNAPNTNAYIGSIPSGWSDVFVLEDAYHQQWNCKVKVQDNTYDGINSNVNFARITAEVEGTPNNVTKSLSGIIRKSSSVLTNAFVSNAWIRINTTNELEINKDIHTTTDGIEIIAKKNVFLRNVYAPSTITVKVTDTNLTDGKDELKVKNIVSQAGAINLDINGVIKADTINTPSTIDVKAKNIVANNIGASGMINLDIDEKLEVNDIHTSSVLNIKSNNMKAFNINSNSIISINVNGTVEINAIKTPNTINITADKVKISNCIWSTDAIVTIQANEIEGSGFVVANHASRIVIKNKSGGTYTGAVPNKKVLSAGDPNTPIVPVPPSIQVPPSVSLNDIPSGEVIESKKDITVYQQGNDIRCQYIIQNPDSTLTLMDKVLLPDMEYTFMPANGSTYSVYFGIKRAPGYTGDIAMNMPTTSSFNFTDPNITVTGIDGGNGNYMINTCRNMSATPDPYTFFRVAFINNKNISYSGEFPLGPAGTGGIIVNEDSEGLRFGSPGSGFIKYEE